ncbi:hypothetical protein JGU66_29260 [Myxococcaceae bacterium JPH2]|nr:hypothetical protein [Myxococcaceae bacterium JPH2]
MNLRVSDSMKVRPREVPPWGSGTWRGLLRLCLCLALLAPALTRAEVSQNVQAYLLSTSRLIEDLEYERALEQINRAKRVAQGPDDDVALSLYEGVVLAELGRGKQEQANAAFKAALFLRPEAQLPVQVSPKLRMLFEDVRRQVQAELAKTPPKPPPPPPPPPSTLRSKALIPAIAGGALAVAGGVSWGLAHGEKAKLRNGDSSIRTNQDVTAVASRGRNLQTVGVGLLTVGVVGLGIATGMYWLGGPSDSGLPSVDTDGKSAFVTWRWP